MALTKIRSDARQPSVRIEPEDGLQTKADAECPLVIAMCYESYLHMYAMQAVFAEQRGDDAADALGPVPRELGSAF